MDASSGRASDLLECGVCYQSFDDASRKPIDLGCGHCFCDECYSSNPSSFRRCPECRSRPNNPHVSIALLRLVTHVNPTDGAPCNRPATSSGQRSATAHPSGSRRPSPSSERRSLLGSGGPLPALVHGSSQGMAAYTRFKDAATGLWQRCLPFMAVLYIISPIDLVPDIIPLLGWLDDLAVMFALLYMCWQHFKPR